MAGAGRKRVPITARDKAILEYVWRWRLVTTAAVYRNLFPGQSWDNAYYRLLRLARLGYVSSVHAGRGMYGWSLTNKGFAEILTALPEGTAKSFRSESPLHDLIATAMHLGSWNSARPPGTELFSEQELRSFGVDLYPEWVPKTQIHRPDGYWKTSIKGRWRTIALEVELHQKAERFYQRVARFYRDRQEVFRIVWLVERLSVARKLSHFIEKEVKADHVVHDFVLLPDFERSGWAAPFVLGLEAGKTVGYLLNFDVSNSFHNYENNSKLDGRKTPHDLEPCDSFPTSRFFNRLALSASPASAHSSSVTDQPPLTNNPSDSPLVQEPLLTQTGGSNNE